MRLAGLDHVVLVAGGIFGWTFDCGNESSSDGHRRDSMKSGCNELSTSEIAQCGCIPLEIS